MGWTSIYQLFWGSLGTRVLTHPHLWLSPVGKSVRHRLQLTPMSFGSAMSALSRGPVSGGTTGVILDRIHVYRLICSVSAIMMNDHYDYLYSRVSIRSWNLSSLDLPSFPAEVAFRFELICIDSGKLCRTPQEIGTLYKPWFPATFYRQIHWAQVGKRHFWFRTSPI